MPRKILQENPQQNPPKFAQQNPRHISAEGPGQQMSLPLVRLPLFKRAQSRPGGWRSNVYVLHAEPKEHKHLRPGTRPGGSLTGATERLFMCQVFMCLFCLLAPITPPPLILFSLVACGWSGLDGRHRAIVLAESLARVVTAFRSIGVRWRSYLPLKNTEFGPYRPCVRCIAIRIAQLAFVGVFP